MDERKKERTMYIVRIYYGWRVERGRLEIRYYMNYMSVQYELYEGTQYNTIRYK